jgi:hypothetical protein
MRAMENARRQFDKAGEGKAVVLEDLDCNLKTEINNFIWMHAPESMTLGEADDMSMKIYGLFTDAKKARQ